MKKIFNSLIVIFLFSCQGNEEKVTVYYLQEKAFYPATVDCKGLESMPEVERKVITDRRFLSEFSSSFQKLADTEAAYPLDTRIRLYYENEGKVDTICMGAFFSIYVNGRAKNNSPEFLRLVKREIYRNN